MEGGARNAARYLDAFIDSELARLGLPADAYALMGFSQGAILRSFMLESVFLALLGGVAGVLLALPLQGVTTGVGNFTTFSDVAFKFKIGPLAVAGGMLFAAVIGAVGGLLPAWAAARKNIIQAMREA